MQIASSIIIYTFSLGYTFQSLQISFSFGWVVGMEGVGNTGT